MQSQIQQTWQQLQNQLSDAQFTPSLPLVLYLAMGGIFGVYIRFLYNRCRGRFPEVAVRRDTWRYTLLEIPDYGSFANIDQRLLQHSWFPGRA